METVLLRPSKATSSIAYWGRRMSQVRERLFQKKAFGSDDGCSLM